MTSARRFRLGALVAGVMLAFVLALSYLAWRVVDERSLLFRDYRSGAWIAVQAQMEYQRLANALNDHQLDPRGASHDGVMQRFDIFRDRIDLTLEGAASERFREMEGAMSALMAIKVDLPQLEQALLALDRNRPETFQAARSFLRPHAEPLRRLVNRNVRDETYLGDGGYFSEPAIAFFVFLGAVFVTGLVLVLLVLAQARRSRKLQEQADRARAQLVDAIESSSQAVMVYDAGDRIVLFNRRCHEIYPDSEDQIFVGQRFEPLLREMTRRGSIGLGQRSQEDFINWRIEQHRRADGLPFLGRLKNGRYLQVTKSRTSEGGVVAVATDITELIQREQALRDSEERYRRLVDLSPDGIYVSREGRFAFVNPAAVRALGAASAAELLGRRVLEFISPGDRREILENAQLITDKGEQLHQVERRYIGLDGREFATEASGIPITHDDAPAVLVIFRDITERKKADLALKESEQRFRDFAEAAADWFWETDADLRFTYLSPNFERIYGLPPESVYGKRREDFLGEGYDREAWNAHLKALQNREPFKDFIYPREIDQVQRWQRLSGIPRFSESGEFLGYRGSATDITAQLETERSLKELDEQVRIIADHAPILITYVTADRRFGFVNKTAEKWFGRAAAEIKGCRRDEILSAEALATTEACAARALSGETCRFADSFRFPDGVVRFAEGVYVPHVDEAGQVRGFFSLIQDVTELKAREAELEASEAQIRLITDNLPILACYVDNERRYRFVNRTGESWYARPSARIVGRRLEEVLGAREYHRLRPSVAEALSGRMVTLEDQLNYPDGIARWVEVTFVPDVSRAGEVRGFYGMIADITELKRREQELRASEEQLRLIADNLPVSIAYADEALRFRFVNRTAAQWVDRAPQEIIGKTLGEVISKSRYDDIKPYLERALRGEQVSFETNSTYNDGVERFIRATYLPHVDEAGRVRGIFGFVVDATEQHRAEELLIQAQKMEAVGQLTGGIAHDFNNLLLAILGNLELLQDRVAGDGKAESFVATALQATQRGGDLTQRLLAFSRKQALRPAVVDINELVSGMVELMQRTLGEAIHIRTHLAEPCHRALVDANQLENALLNLALNARDAMSEGGELVIATRNVELAGDYFAHRESVEPGDYVMLAVSDCGCGMEPEVLERAFDPFFTTKDIGEGSGLGLSMVYGFVKQTGGHVTIFSDPGRGTTVKLFLPSAEVRAERDATAETAPLPSGRETILLVEDDAAVRAYVKESLSGLGYKVLEAAHGAEAERIVRGLDRLDLLLTDMVLPPGLNGRELAEAVRSRFPGLPCLFASGYPTRAAGREARLDEDIELLEKPFTRAVLARRVRELLDGARGALLDDRESA